MKLFIGDNVTYYYQFDDFAKTYHGEILSFCERDGRECAKIKWYGEGRGIEIPVCNLKIDEGAIIAKAWAEKFPDYKFDPNTRKIIPKKAPKEMKKADNWVWINGPDASK